MAVTLAPTVAGLLRAQAKIRPNQVALRWRVDGAWAAMTWAEYGRRAAALALGLQQLGVRKGERVLMMTPNCPAFHVSDSALLLLGACPVSVHLGSPADYVTYVAEHSGATAAIVAGTNGLDGFREALPQLPQLRHVLVADGDQGVATESWPDLVAREADLDAVPDDASPEDLATIIYTSGTTGRPKGVMITQANVVWIADRMMARIGVPIEGWSQISYLPLAHLGERNATHYHHLRGATVVYCCPDMSTFFDDLRDVEPDILNAVPRIWEKLHDLLLAELARAGDESNPDPRRAVGLSRCRLALSTGAPLNRDVLRSLRAMGIPVSEGYGMTESAGPVTWDPYEVRIGTAGRPLDDTEIRLAPDGELQFRSGGAFKGYWRDPEQTAATIDPEGWVSTGDIATVDEYGYLTIIDRKKEIIVTSGGLNVAPTPIEGLLKECPLVEHACVIGDGRRFISAIVTINRAAARRWLGRADDPPDATFDEDDLATIRAEIERWVNEVNTRLRGPEQIKRFEVVDDDWAPDTGELTASLKLRRRVVEGRYQTLIERMYEPADATTSPR